MKILIAAVTFTEKEVEIPETCPACGASLDRGALRGAFLRDEFHSLDPSGESTGDADLGDTFHLTGLWCRDCQHVLAGDQE